jgi:hypothetical protein
MDGKLLKAAIKYETTFPGCVAPRVCYEVTHSNIYDVPAGSTLSLTITGTKNQDSVRDAGKFLLQTQLKELTGAGSYYNIDKGEFPSNFMTQKGGISLTTGKAMTSSNYETYANDAAYTIFITTYDYIPAGGSLAILLPSEVDIEGNAMDNFKSSASSL